MVLFAGSAQFITVSLLASFTNGVSIIATIFVVNFRHFLMSSAYSKYFKNENFLGNGPANTNNAAGLARLFAGGGFSDWYLPAKNELEVCYFNLKPTTTSNNTASGINANAVPARASNYTAGTPAQTSATDFQTGNTEAFFAGVHWSSTEISATTAGDQGFGAGTQYSSLKTGADYVRAIRRVAV